MQKNTILLDLQYLPPLQWFSKITKYETVILEASEHYVKGSYRNRCHIAGAQGLLRLSVPLKGGKNAQTPIREVGISNVTPWQYQHWESIQSAYGKSPFFEYYVDDLKPIFEKEYDKLWDLNYDLVQSIVDMLDLDVTFALTETYKKQTEETILDFRGGIHPNPAKAMEDPDFEVKTYEQVFTEKYDFLENLSILDVLFCKGPETVLLF